MGPDEDVRARALVDQLNEIDQRILTVKGFYHLTLKKGLLNAGILGISLVVLDSVVPTAEQVVIKWAFRAGVLMVGILIIGWPLIRGIETRKLERERDRVLALYEEIDRRVALRSGSKTQEGNVS